MLRAAGSGFVGVLAVEVRAKSQAREIPQRPNEYQLSVGRFRLHTCPFYVYLEFFGGSTLKNYV
jgi:hypothetical protein